MSESWYTPDEIRIIDRLQGNKSALVKLKEIYLNREEDTWGNMNMDIILKHISKRIKECKEETS